MEEADGHNRNAICSNSQRLPSSAVTCSGRPPVEKVLNRPPSLAVKNSRVARTFCSASTAAIKPESAPTLMKFHCRSAPRGEGATGWTASQAEGARHGLGRKTAQPTHGRGRAERSENAGTVIAALAH